MRRPGPQTESQRKLEANWPTVDFIGKRVEQRNILTLLRSYLLVTDVNEAGGNRRQQAGVLARQIQLRTNPQSCNIKSGTEMIHGVDRYARRQQTYETVLLSEDECVTPPSETDLRKL